MEFLRFEPKYGRGGNRRIPWHSLAGQIEIEGVHFWYPTRMGHEVLNGLNMRIGAGQTVAICGPSGAGQFDKIIKLKIIHKFLPGKSTVASLIERLYEPQAGQITLDGLDLRQLDPKWLRREAIGVISQEPVLFSTSIRENIRYGRMDATEKEVVKKASEKSK
jgi:ABC-type multidrug transport system fused ATPase/permease subunit